MNKQQFIRVLRDCGLISLAELTHFQLIRARNLLDNYAFHRTFHNFAVPPDRFLYATCPPLDFPYQFFNGIYSVSVFTHLSESMHYAWIPELARVLKPSGILMLTLHGDLYSEKLLPDELVTYQKGALVVRDQVIEGSRFFAVFHPTSFVHKWLGGFDILAHIQNPLPLISFKING
jgi:hypothetical protein